MRVGRPVNPAHASVRLNSRATALVFAKTQQTTLITAVVVVKSVRMVNVVLTVSVRLLVLRPHPKIVLELVSIQTPTPITVVFVSTSAPVGKCVVQASAPVLRQRSIVVGLASILAMISTTAKVVV